ncbi:hypothetical protein KJ590_02755, partial [Patescibacteria group bacterium]|nr:hypothetical protein [Patescibacteria group bacterium]
MRQWRILISSFLLISGLLFGQSTFAYEPDPTHTALAQKSAEVFNQFSGGNLSGEEIGWIREGARNEDTPPRWINHFYDPVTGQGWTSERMGQLPSSVVSLFSGMVLSSEKAAAAPAWAQDQNLQVKYKDYEGNRAWQRAVFDYVNGDKKEALKSLGHILHLIADMAVP